MVKTQAKKSTVLNVAAALAAVGAVGALFFHENWVWISAQWLTFMALVIMATRGVVMPEKPATMREMPNALWQIGGAVSIFLLMFIAYWNILTMPFIDGDDYIHMIDARNILEKFSGRELLDFFLYVTNNDAEQLVRPLLNLPFVIAYGLFADGVVGYHIMNIAAHGLAAVALYLMVLLLSGRISGALLAGILFAVHPALSRPIAWTAALTHTFPTLFFLLSVLFFVLYRKSARPRTCFTLACGFLLLDIAMWELGALIAPLLVLIDVLFFKEAVSKSKGPKRFLPHLLTFGLVGLYAGNILLRIGLFDIDVGRHYLDSRLGGAQGPHIAAFFTAMLTGIFRPYHQGVFYGATYRFFASAGLVAIGAFVFYAAKTRRYNGRMLLLGMVLMIGAYLPVYKSAQINLEFLMRTRLLILPIAGFAVAVAALLESIKLRRRTAVAIVIFLGFTLCSVTAQNNRAWLFMAEKQKIVQENLDRILEKYDPSRPVFFISASPDHVVAEDPENYLVTAFARKNYFEKSVPGVWYLLYDGRIETTTTKDWGTLVPVGWPVFVGMDPALTGLSDESEKVQQDMIYLAAQSGDLEAPLTYRPAQVSYPPDVIPLVTMILRRDGQTVTRLTGRVSEISKKRLMLHTLAEEEVKPPVTGQW